MRFKTMLIAIAAVLCMSAFFVPANAQTNEELSVNDNVESTSPLTPSGNLTLVDDIYQSSEIDGEVEDKQFITVQSKNGNYFYLIIDRSGDTENVYFLNAVDEADLLALIDEDEQPTEAAAVCTCTEKCEVGSVNVNCAVCSVNKDSCTAPASVTVDETESDTEASEDGGSAAGSVAILLIFVLLGGGGAFYWFKVKNKKSSINGTADGDTDPDDLYEDDEDYEIEGEENEADEEADNENDEEDGNEEYEDEESEGV